MSSPDFTKVAEELVDSCRQARLGKTQESVDYNLDNKRWQCVAAIKRALDAAYLSGAGEENARP